MAERKAVETEKAPGALGPYSQGLAVGNMLFVSGQLGMDPATGKLVEGGTAAQTQQALNQLTNAVRLEVTQHYLALKEAEEMIAVGQKTVEQAQENLRVAEEKYEVDMATNTDLLDAQAMLTQAKMAHVRALADHQIAQARLQRAMGTLSQ